MNLINLLLICSIIFTLYILYISIKELITNKKYYDDNYVKNSSPSNDNNNTTNKLYGI